MATPGALVSLQIAEEHLLLRQRLQPEDIPSKRRRFCAAFVSFQHSQRKEVAFRLQVLVFAPAYGCTIFLPQQLVMNLLVLIYQVL